VDFGEKEDGKAKWDEWLGVSVLPLGKVIVGPEVSICLSMQNVEGLM